jgi:enoyl-CoA hydratase/carnithine racemase
MIMTDRPITPEQALVAGKAAGLDPDKPLSEQLRGDRSGALERQIADLSERVNTLSDLLAEGGQSTSPQSHELLAKQLHDAQSEWMTLGGPDGEAA